MSTTIILISLTLKQEGMMILAVLPKWSIFLKMKPLMLVMRCYDAGDEVFDPPPDPHQLFADPPEPIKHQLLQEMQCLGGRGSTLKD
jgi:hypothetical protein